MNYHVARLNTFSYHYTTRLFALSSALYTGRPIFYSFLNFYLYFAHDIILSTGLDVYQATTSQSFIRDKDEVQCRFLRNVIHDISFLSFNCKLYEMKTEISLVSLRFFMFSSTAIITVIVLHIL